MKSPLLHFKGHPEDVYFLIPGICEQVTLNGEGALNQQMEFRLLVS